jgi:hypothetical protein
MREDFREFFTFRKLDLWKKLLIISTLASVVFFSWGIDSWRFSYVGDEWAFYDKALEIISKNFMVNPLSMKGVYLENPLLGSVWHALFMRILGPSNFSWRLSQTILIAPISLFFYLWVSKLFNRSVGLLSTLFFQWSFYAANYFKLGPVNPQSVALFVLCLYLSDLAARSGKLKHYVLVGVFLGISFYIYLGPIFVFLVWPFFLRAFTEKNFKLSSLISKVTVMLITAIIVISPGLFDQDHWNAAAKKTIFVREFTGHQQIYINIYRNFQLFYRNYDYMFNHFISGPYLDVISRILATGGILICLYKIRRLSYLSLILGYVAMGVMLGLTSPYSYAPTSRGIFLLPYGFVFAALGLEKISNYSKAKWFIFLVVVGIISINIYRSQIEYFDVYGYKHSALILRHLMDHRDSHSTLYISNAANIHYNYSNLYSMMRAFGIPQYNLSILERESINCDQVPTGYLLVLDQDPQAIESLSNLICPQSLENKVVINSKFSPY